MNTYRPGVALAAHSMVSATPVVTVDVPQAMPCAAVEAESTSELYTTAPLIRSLQQSAR